MRPHPIPQVYPTTYAEDARYLRAHRRHVLYKNNGAVDQLTQQHA